ncbi:MAG: type II toxin-antitoxin system ParD family antitoxin [Bacteroidetes bacterium]|nr:type II toxin-antitoxin system ParD family antitoxin [Bacteroidota bacterium]
MGKNTSISLGGHFENFIHNEIESGRYNSVSEVIRSALRLLEVEEKKTIELRKALKQGEKSKMADDFNPSTHLKNLHSNHL